MKIGDRIYVRGYVDEIRKDTVIVRNDGGYFGTIPSEVITGELPSARLDVPDKNVGDMISMDAAMEMLMNQNVIMDSSEYHNGFNAGVNRAQEVIRNLPPVQTEIIHCKDCAFYEKEIGGNDGFALGMCRFIEQHYVTNEGFCFCAKKKGE